MSDFNALLEPQIPRLRRYTRALLGDPGRADDLVQDTLVRALAKQHLWEEGTDLRAWLFTLMHNLHVDGARQAGRDRAVVDVDQVSEALVANTDPSASRELRELKAAITRLPDEQREALLLIGLEGVRYDEAAAILGVPIGTVRSRLFRARETLRCLFDRTVARHQQVRRAADIGEGANLGAEPIGEPLGPGRLGVCQIRGPGAHYRRAQN